MEEIVKLATIDWILRHLYTITDWLTARRQMMYARSLTEEQYKVWGNTQKKLSKGELDSLLRRVGLSYRACDVVDELCIVMGHSHQTAKDMKQYIHDRVNCGIGTVMLANPSIGEGSFTKYPLLVFTVFSTYVASSEYWRDYYATKATGRIG